MFHCFSISRHISISVLFFIISVSCFAVFLLDFENNCPRVGFTMIFLNQESGFSHLLCAREVGSSPFQQILWGFARLVRGHGNRPVKKLAC